MPLSYDQEWHQIAAPMLAMRRAAIPIFTSALEAQSFAKENLGKIYAALPIPSDVKITQHEITSYDGAKILLYQYMPATVPSAMEAGFPAIFHIHGGGMYAGDTAAFRPLFLNQVAQTGIPMFDVEYRLAPQNPHPTPVEDSFAGLKFVFEKAAELGVDVKRVALQGESAGGGIAAGVALMARDRGLPPLNRMLLVYPMLDCRNVKPRPGETEFFTFNEKSNRMGWTALLGEDVVEGRKEVEGDLVYGSPAYAKDVKGLPTAFIDVGGLDLFRDEDIAFAGKLAAAEIQVEFHLYPGVPHGFEGSAKESSVAKAAMANRYRFLAGL